MSKRNLKNKNLDRIAVKLLNARRSGDEEIERIVVSPALFDAVKMRIETERRRRGSENAPKRRFWNRGFAKRRAPALVTAVLLGIFVSAGILVNLDKFSIRNTEKSVGGGAPAPATLTNIKQDMEPPKEMPQFEKTDFRPNDALKKNRSVQLAKTAAAVKKSDRKPARKMPPESAKKAPPVKFYALGFSENIGETGEELQIVRAELSRSQLFALGVNLPIENGPEKIKTDLLVGRDGVARAIRLVD